jgi:hypothetical protein
MNKQLSAEGDGLADLHSRGSTPLLRILFLIALFCLQAFLLHLSKHLCHVINFVPNIKTYVDRGALLNRHRDTIAGSCIYLDDVLPLRFVLRAEYKSGKIGVPLEIVNDHPFDLCSKRSQDTC